MSATSGRDTRSTRPGSSSHGGPCMPSAAKGWRTFPSPPCGGGSCICSLPPCGGGLGWGGALLVCIVLPPPHPSPPPQGGREFCFSLPHKGGGSCICSLLPCGGGGCICSLPHKGGGRCICSLLPCGGGSCICSLPPCGGGLGWGVRTPCLHCTYPPHPSPPPQGGREFCPLAHYKVSLTRSFPAIMTFWN